MTHTEQHLTGARVFITGGAGFIGSTLAGRLADDNEVTLYDNFSRDAFTGTKLAEHPNVRAVRGDILDPAALGAAMAGHTHVVHCAAIAGIDTVTRSPVTTMRVNMIGSSNVLEAANALDECARVVCFSTSEVFGRRAFQVTETSDTVMGAVGEPRWTYAVSKLAEEHLAIAYHSEFGLPVAVVRPFNVYGPGQVGEGAIRNFMQRALRDEPIQIYGDGSQIRAWCYVDDMVRSVLISLVHPAAVGESFNIGNARAVATTTGLAQTIVRITGSSSTITYVARAGVDVELRVPATTKASELIGFDAEVDLDEGIARTADFMRSQS
jgi:UDP-glucose 4-epimerase